MRDIITHHANSNVPMQVGFLFNPIVSACLFIPPASPFRVLHKK